MIANWICVPISNKLKLQNNDEYQLREIIIEGLLSIQAGENPRVIEEKSLSLSFHHLPEQHYLNKEEVKADG